MSRECKNGIILMCMGIALVAIPFYLRVKEDHQTDMYIAAFEEKADEEKTETDKAKKDALLLQEDVIGIIEIPSLDIKYPIFEGTGNDALNNGIGHMERTTGLGEKGNCVLCGHNGSRYGEFFTNLSNVQMGDEVIITTKTGGKKRYEIREMKTVHPYDSWVAEDSQVEELTIFTCANRGTNRFVCKCRPISKGGGANQ